MVWRLLWQKRRKGLLRSWHLLPQIIWRGCVALNADGLMWQSGRAVASSPTPLSRKAAKDGCSESSGMVSTCEAQDKTTPQLVLLSSAGRVAAAASWVFRAIEPEVLPGFKRSCWPSGELEPRRAGGNQSLLAQSNRSSKPASGAAHTGRGFFRLGCCSVAQHSINADRR